MTVVALLSGVIWSVAAVSPSDSTLARQGDAPTAAPSRVSAEGPGPAEAVPPGLRGEVQRWFAARDRPLIRMNNALVPVVLGTLGTPGPRSAECRELDASVRALRGVGASPHARITELATAGLAEVQQAARACLDGDREGTRRLAEVGLRERAAASLELDETLEGE